jgi:GNAT superfamily N-acetyltransferase
MKLTVHRVTDHKSPEFEALVDLYLAAHPASELKPVDLLSEMAQRSDYLFLTVHLDHSVVGFSVVNINSQSDAAMLEYMAVAELWRGQGIGQHLFQQITEMREVFGRYLIVEVDSDKRPSPLQRDNSRRKRFYKNLGCREIAGLDYVMPPVSTHAPPAMDIMVYRHALPVTVAKVQLQAWLQALYVNIYSMQATDIRIDQMLENLPQNIDLM